MLTWCIQEEYNQVEVIGADAEVQAVRHVVGEPWALGCVRQRVPQEAELTLKNDYLQNAKVLTEIPVG